MITLKSIQCLAEKTALLLAILFAVLLPYNMLYSTIIIYPIILCALISFRKEKLKLIPKQAWFCALIFLLSLVGYAYSQDTWRASYLLERQLTILLFPIILPLALTINARNIKLILSFFTASCVGSLLFLFYHCVDYLFANHLPISSITDPIFYNHHFSEPIGIHASYFSIYISLAISFLLSLFSESKAFQKFLIIAAILFLGVGLFFLASRNTIIATILVIVVLFPLFNTKNKGRFFALTLLSIALFLWVGNHSNYITSRFSKELIEDIQPSSHYSLENPEPRIMRWQIAWDLIKKAPLFGYGSGDEIGLLKEQYLKKKMMVSYREEFNTHNQYLAILLKNGFVGLILFMGMLFYFFNLAIRTRHFIYCSFLLVLTIGFFTENIIDANKGIFFFAFFNTLFGYLALYKKKSESLIATTIQS